jgi:hypothetical protein
MGTVRGWLNYTVVNAVLPCTVRSTGVPVTALAMYRDTGGQTLDRLTGGNKV